MQSITDYSNLLFNNIKFAIVSMARHNNFLILMCICDIFYQYLVRHVFVVSSFRVA